MALRYFDRNGATAGFGTLTGAWDTTTASWSDSAAGTAIPTTFTFSDVDQAQFGSAGGTSTAGTATIAAGLNVTVNQIITANIAAAQTIAAGVGGTLTLAGATPTINVGSAGGLSITSAITGSAGFTKAGAGTLTLQNTGNSFTGPSNPLSITGTGGLLFDGSLTTPVATTTLSGITSISVASSNYYAIAAIGNSFSVTAPISGSGLVAVASVSTTIGPTFAVGSLSGLTGTTAPTGSGTTVFVAAGFYVYGEGGTANRKASYATVNDFPSTGNTTWIIEAFSASCAAVIKYAGAGGTFNGPLYALLRTNTNIATATTALYANGSGALVLTGAFKRDGTTGNFVFTLGGTSASNVNNTLSGNITETGGVFAISKSDANKWILSGANTYTGTTTISAGTLSAQGERGTKTQLGSSGAVTTSGTGVLDVSSTPYAPITAPNGTDAANPMIVDKTTRTVTLGSTGNPQLTSTTGFNRLDCGSVVLSTDLLVSVAADAYLKLNNSAAMTGVSRSATKTGDGEFDFGTFANQFSSTSGTVTVSAGTASFGASVLAGSASPLGQSSTAIALAGTLKYNGASTASLTRAVSLSGSPSFDASGAAAITMTPTTLTHSTGGTRTITFTGTSAFDNTFNTVIANNNVDSAVVSLTKTGASKWVVSQQPTYTGLTTVSAGELQFNETNLANNLTVNGTGKLSKTVLDGSGKTITCDNGTPEIVATTSANTVSGTTSVTGGVLRLTTDVSASSKPVTVLGTTDVTVSALAAIRTSTGNTQAGKMRYGKDLTFGANSSLYIGG